MIRLAALLLILPGLANAGSVTVRNGTSETIRGIHMAPAGSGSVGDNRMRSQLPPGAEARITYSTGCRADVRLAFASGRTEDHPGVDVCADSRITAGQEGTAGPAMAAASPAAPSTRATPASATTPISASLRRAPPPVVPPWTGRSITRRFGGMD